MFKLKMTGYTRRSRTVIVSFALILICLPAAAMAGKVTDWNLVATTAENNQGSTNNAIIAIDCTYMHIAVYDAVNAIDGTHAPFAVQPSSVPAGASKEAAAVEAAYRVLRFLIPAQAAYLDGQYALSLASIPDGTAKTDGMAVGAETAAMFLSSRTGDGRNAAITYTPGSGPGAWIPTPPAFASAATPWLAYMRPFAILSNSQFRVPAPPALRSIQYAEDLDETKRFGSINSTERTPAQTELARFFLDVTIYQAANGIRKVATDHNLGIADEARLFAQVYVSLSDAFIAGWDSKLAYGFWRPVTAIRNASTDGNPLTEQDAAWSPLTATPAHPEYPSAHSFVTGSYTQALDEFFRTPNIDFTLTSTTTGTTRQYTNIHAVMAEVLQARVFAGFHFRTACLEGQNLGESVARYVAQNYFQPRRKRTGR